MKKSIFLTALLAVMAMKQGASQSLLSNGGFESGYALCSAPGTNPADPSNTNGPFVLDKQWVTNWGGYAVAPFSFFSPVALENMITPSVCGGKIQNGIFAAEGTRVIDLGIAWDDGFAAWAYNVAFQKLGNPLAMGDYDFCQKATSNATTVYSPGLSNVTLEVYLSSSMGLVPDKYVGTYLIPDETPSIRVWHTFNGTFNINSFESGKYDQVNYKLVANHTRTESVGVLLDDVKLGTAGAIYCGDPTTPCSADFMYQSYSFNPNVFEVFPIASSGATYKVNWGDGSGYVPITSSHLYAPGSYTLCVKEYRDGVEFCTRCKDICVSGGTFSVPSDCDFIYRSYSNTPRVLQVIPYSMPSGATVYDYIADWGDFSTPGAPTSSHLYAADGTYSVCLSYYGGHPVSKLCEKCVNVCIGGGGSVGYARYTTEQDIQSGTEEKIYPNPASNGAVLQLDLVSEEHVEVVLQDITGRRIQDVYSGRLTKGVHQISVKTDQLTNAVYHVKVKKGNQVSIHQLSVVK